MQGQILRPTYYTQFQCTGGDCKYTCCNHWSVSVNKHDYDKLRSASMPPELDEIVRRTFKRIKEDRTRDQYAAIQMNNDGEQLCPLLNEEGLCRFQLTCGYDYLPAICKQFPRSVAHMQGSYEQSLSIGCEEVVRLLLAQQDGVAFESVQDEVVNYTKWIAEINDNLIRIFPIAAYHFDLQILFLSLLQLDSCSLDDRVLLVGMAIKELMALEQETHRIPAFVDQFLTAAQSGVYADAFPDFEPNPCVVVSDAQKFLSRFSGTPTLSHFQERVYANLGITVHQSEDRITTSVDAAQVMPARQRFAAFLNRHPRALENILVNELFTRTFPFNADFDLWDAYIQLVYLYTLLKVSAAGFLDDSLQEADFIRAVVMVGREYAHAKDFRKQLCATLKENDSASLAHLVYLVRW